MSSRLAAWDPRPPRRILIHDQADRDAIAQELLRDRDERGDDWADIIDFLILHKEERPKALRLLARSRPADQR